MPITSSARKALRVGLRRTQENRQTKQAIRTTLKKATGETLPQAFSILDKAAKKGVIHPNKAARLKSRLNKQLTGEVAAAPEKKATTKAKATKKTTKKSTAKKVSKKGGFKPLPSS
jgi:small subunit ribosomal protein S20